MVEGLILLAELVAVGLLLWTVQRHDTPGASAPTDLFAYRDPDVVVKAGARAGKKRGKNHA